MTRLLLLVLLLAAAAPARAQDADTPFEPVLLVNERAITAFELSQRARMLELFGAGGDLRALAREQLITERLQLQAGDRLELDATEEQIEAGAREFAERRGIALDEIRAGLAQAGVAEQTFNDFIRAGITWRTVVEARFRRIATPSESDLDAALELANRGVRESVRLQEIGIPFAERGEQASMELARRLSRELNGRGNFTAAVRRYSRSPSRQQDGRIGWTPIQSLPPALGLQLLGLEVGEVTAPVEIPEGVTILKLLDRREEPLPPSEQAGPVTVSYSQLIAPVAASADPAAVEAATRQLRRIRSEVELCTDVDARADEFGLGSGRSEPTPVGQLPPEVARPLSDMDPGDIEILRDARGVVLLMLCDRSDQVSPEEREALRQRLFNQRMVTLGQGLLADLRGAAVIEER